MNYEFYKGTYMGLLKGGNISVFVGYDAKKACLLTTLALTGQLTAAMVTPTHSVETCFHNYVQKV